MTEQHQSNADAKPPKEIGPAWRAPLDEDEKFRRLSTGIAVKRARKKYTNLLMMLATEDLRNSPNGDVAAQMCARMSADMKYEDFVLRLAAEAIGTGEILTHAAAITIVLTYEETPRYYILGVPDGKAFETTRVVTTMNHAAKAILRIARAAAAKTVRGREGARFQVTFQPDSNTSSIVETTDLLKNLHPTCEYIFSYTKMSAMLKSTGGIDDAMQLLEGDGVAQKIADDMKKLLDYDMIENQDKSSHHVQSIFIPNKEPEMADYVSQEVLFFTLMHLLRSHAAGGRSDDDDDDDDD